jgi:hypothetical protein
MQFLKQTAILTSQSQSHLACSANLLLLSIAQGYHIPRQPNRKQIGFLISSKTQIAKKLKYW